MCVCACLCSLLDNAWKQELHRLHHGTAQLQTFRLQQAQAAKQRESLGSGPSSPGQHQGDEQDPGLGQAHEQHCHAHVNEQHEQDLGLSPLWDVLSNPCVHALMSAIQWHTTPSGQRFALHALDLSRSVPVGCTLHVYWVHCNCVCMRVCARACVCVCVSVRMHLCMLLCACRRVASPGIRRTQVLPNLCRGSTCFGVRLCLAPALLSYEDAPCAPNLSRCKYTCIKGLPK